MRASSACMRSGLLAAALVCATAGWSQPSFAQREAGPPPAFNAPSPPAYSGNRAPSGGSYSPPPQSSGPSAQSPSSGGGSKSRSRPRDDGRRYSNYGHRDYDRDDYWRYRNNDWRYGGLYRYRPFERDYWPYAAPAPYYDYYSATPEPYYVAPAPYYAAPAPYNVAPVPDTAAPAPYYVPPQATSPDPYYNPPPAGAAGTRYYCSGSGGYFPEVQSCSCGWTALPPPQG